MSKELFVRAEEVSKELGISKPYVVMAVAYDEDVAAITYQNQELTPLDINGYHLFYGTGTGKYEVYELFDQEGNRLEHIKE